MTRYSGTSRVGSGRGRFPDFVRPSSRRPKTCTEAAPHRSNNGAYSVTSSAFGRIDGGPNPYRRSKRNGFRHRLSSTPERNYLRTHRPTMPLAPLQLTLPFWKTGGPPTSLQIADTIISLSSQAVMSSFTSNARKLEGPASPRAPLAPGAPEGPGGPISPRMPWGPAGPCDPASPWGLVGPVGPGAPVEPCAPVGP
jgi:hypothetical protein